MSTDLISGYTIAVHEVTTNSVKLWIGALAPAMGKPHHWRLVISETDSNKPDIISDIYTEEEWLKPFDALQKRFYSVKIIEDLKPNVHYTVQFQTRFDKKYWPTLEKAYFSTLPSQLPNASEKPFTVGIGSCFYAEHDGGLAGKAYKALYNEEALRPDITFLMGDQVYVDIGLGLFSLDDSDCQERVADHYKESWKLLRSILRRGGTWMISDDHEYWNNYPFLESFNPYLITLELDDEFRGRWTKAAEIGVKTIQQVSPIRTFEIGNELSFCVADLRIERSEIGFLSAASQRQLIAWINNLNTPGILTIPQPLIADNGGDKDKNLPDWKNQYDEILIAIEAGNHDIVILTGDVHFGRVSEVKVGNSNNKLIEVITSPMSNLSELDGFFTNKPDMSDMSFPLVPVDNMPTNPVSHLAKVTTERKFWDLRYPVARTHEHFMTVEFSNNNGKVQMNINAYHARKFSHKTALPEKIRGFSIDPITLN